LLYYQNEMMRYLSLRVLVPPTNPQNEKLASYHKATTLPLCHSSNISVAKKLCRIIYFFLDMNIAFI
jgi:hypothetical protein